MTWDEVAQSDPQLQTDKCRRLPAVGGGWQVAHGYLDHYQRLLGGLPITSLLEVGVAGGHSLRLWERLFPGATIVGLDIDPRSAAVERERAHVVLADAAGRDVWKQIANETPQRSNSFDVIIDDGSHRPADVRAAFASFKNRLTFGGFYFIEDMDPSFIGTLLVEHGEWSASVYPSLVSLDQSLTVLRKLCFVGGA